MTQLTSQGFTRSRLDERLSALQDAVRAIFGPNINIDPDTIDGQTLGVFAESISNLDQLAEDVYHSFNPQSATGVALSRLVQLNGISRIEGTYSTVDLLCVGQQGTFIPAGSLVKSTATNATFQTIADATVPDAGQIVVAAKASVKGAVLAPAGTLTTIDTPIFGWQTVSNALDAVPGRDEETDEQLRMRRRASTSTSGQAILDALYGALTNIPEVLQARVYENDQDAVDANGLPPHSIYCIVEGGADADILDTIWLKKTAGTTTHGTTTGAVVDSMGNLHTLKFSRPVDVNVWLTVNLHTRAGWPTDGAQRIKDALTAWAVANQSIGEEVIQSRLFDPINSVAGHSIDSLYIGTAAGPTGAANIAVPFDGLSRFDSGRIVVNVL
ncbi:MAG: baseplate J/gp47 family protein [Thiobacillus sp.]